MTEAETAVATLVEQLTLRPTGDDTFEGAASFGDGMEGAVFGGHFLGQAAAAVLATVDEDRTLHSLHGYFMRAGISGEPFDIRVERVRDGRSFNQRRVVISQHGRDAFELIASCTVPAEGPEHSVPRPRYFDSLPQPEDLPKYHELMASLPELPFPEEWALREHGVDGRIISAPWAPSDATPHRGITKWVRAAAPISPDPKLHQAMLAYESDESISDNIAIPFDVTWGDPDVVFVSLDHAMWFHRPVDMNDWLFIDQRPVTLASQRGLATAEVWSRDGQLVATFTQEALLRF